MRREIKTEVDIHASAARVWEILSDFPQYTHWNPYITRLRGRVGEGERIRFWFGLPFGGRLPACARVLKAVPCAELRWAGSLLIPGLMRAEHYHVIEAVGAQRVRFHHGEIFTGLLAWLLWPLLARAGVRLYEDASLALKQRAERQPS